MEKKKVLIAKHKEKGKVINNITEKTANLTKHATRDLTIFKLFMQN